MTDQRGIRQDLHQDLASYLLRNGWSAGPNGRLGSLWTHAGSPALAVPYELHRSSDEFDAVVLRIGQSEGRPAREVADDVEREFLDVQEYRIADRYVIEDSVLLGSAATVLASAQQMIRAAAMTARKPRPLLRSRYSTYADDIASRARLSHTRHGSFLLPIVIPVEPAKAQEDQLEPVRTDLEPGERRVTRTLASAVAALDTIAVRPDREPDATGIADLVQSGVSRELVTAVKAIARDAGVRAFDTRFRWAPGLQRPGGLPDRVVIPDDAVKLLGRIEQRLTTAQPDVSQTLSGQIVEVRHLPGDPLGEVAIRTIRNNRTVEVRITAQDTVIQEAAEWFRDQRAVLVRGHVQSVPGHPLSIPRPDTIHPLDELFAVRDPI